MDFAGDVELESEIEAIVAGALEPTEEHDAVEVLAAWKQTGSAIKQEKLSRGLKTPVYPNSNNTASTGNFPKPDLAR